MPQLLQGIEPRAGTVCVLARRVLIDDELIGLHSIDEQFLPFQALPAQHRDFRLHIAPASAFTIDLGQFQGHALAIAYLVGAVGVVQMVVHRPAGAADNTDGQGSNEQLQGGR